MRTDMAACKPWRMWTCVQIFLFLALFMTKWLPLLSQAPEISSEISFLRLLIGKFQEEKLPFVLTITATGSQPLNYTWEKDGTVVFTSSGRGGYTVNKANVSDSGVYRCTVSNALGSVRSLPFSVEVRELGEFEQTSSQTVIVEEKKFTVLRLQKISHLPGTFFSVAWDRDDVTVTQGSFTFYQTLDYDLAVLDVPTNFNGSRFTATANHATFATIKEMTSPAFILKVTASGNGATFIAPEFVVSPKDTTAVAGETVRLECVINAKPTNNLQIDWYKETNGSRYAVTNDRRISITTLGRRLEITSVNATDSGLYLCEGRLKGQSTFSPVTAQAIVTVTDPPSITSSSPVEVLRDYQEAFAFDCEAFGSQPLQVDWYFNAKKLADGNAARYQIYPNGTLEIASVDVPDSGVYQCFAKNSAGEASAYTRLTVNSAAPTIEVPPQNKIIAEHEDTAFTCGVKGGPRPVVVWSKDGKSLEIGGRIRLVNDQLLIGRVEMADSGVYVCTGSNIKGTVSANATLSVIVKTQIFRPPQDTSSILTTDTSLDCGVRSDPSVTPSWRWFFYLEAVFGKTEINGTSGRKLIGPDGSLTITDLNSGDSGIYECVVSSAGGGDARNATLNVIDRPSRPVVTSVMLYDQLLNSVQVSWSLSFDGGTPITGFTVQIRKESFSGSSIENSWESIKTVADPSARSAIVGNLHPSSYYRFRVYADNLVGPSEASDAFPKAEVEAIKMPAQPPGEAPRNLFCRQGSQQEIVVQWEPPPEASWNGDPRGYYIFYKVAGFADDTEKVKTLLGKDAKKTTLNNLAYYKKYRVKIAAFNEKGGGVNSSAFYVTTLQGVPTVAPGNVVVSSPNSTTIRLEWDPPPPRLINGVNQGYVIELSQGMYTREISVPFDEQNPNGRQAFDIINLLKFTMYEVTIACRTATGPGPFSAPRSFRTLEDVPGPVQDLVIDNIRDRSLRINWKPPLEKNGNLTGYRIKYQEKGVPTTLKTEEAGPEVVSQTISELSYRTNYIISVEAKTRVGPGPPSVSEIVSGVPPELPGPPTRLAVTNIEARSVLLQFIPGFDGKTIITLWIVQAQVNDDPEWTHVYNISDPDADQITVLNLRPYTRYRLRVIAQNIVDKSEPSEPCDRFETMQAAPGMPPDDVTPRAISPTAIRMRWRQIPRTEWNGKFLGYKIYYRRWSLDVDNSTSPSDVAQVREDQWTEVELRNGSMVQEHTLTGLQEWLDYQIYMISYNKVGNSAPSETMSERTEEDVPSKSPSNIDLLATSSTTILVSWGSVPVLEQNGNIIGYKVKYKPQWSPDVEFKKVQGASTFNVTLTGLRKFMDYDVQVLAFSRMGDGVLSDIYRVKTESDVPGPPTNVYFPVVTEDSATIVWEKPTEENGIIFNYKVTWRRKDQQDSASQTAVKQKTEFEHSVTGLEREKFYVFSVSARTEEDGFGEAAVAEVYTTSLRERPDTPFNLRIDESKVTARTITLDWIPGKNNFSPVRNFTIQYKEKTGSWTAVESPVKPQSTQYTVTGLRPNSWYKFRVAATNDVGTSDWSDESAEVPTKQDVPDGAPENVKIVALTRTDIKITWTPPGNWTWNGYMVQDMVQYREEGAEAYREEEVNFNQNTFIKRGLTIGVKYEIRVRACNTVGCGPPSVLQVFRVGDIAPTAAPVRVTVTSLSSTDLEITWQPPPKDNINGVLIGYTVLYWSSPTDTCEERSPNSLLESGLSVLLEDLNPYTIYCSTVQAVNLAGTGPKSSLIARRTLEDRPGPPANLRFSNIGLEELVVQWDPPIVPNGLIKSYELQYYVTVDGETAKVTRTLSGSETQQNVTDLAEEERYTFTLAAFTAIGKGNVTQKSVRTGWQPGSPDPPGRPTVMRQSKNLVITWEKRGPGKSPITGYLVRSKERTSRQARSTASNKWQELVRVNSPEPSATVHLSLLKPNVSYAFRVRAINSYGISNASLATDFYETPSSLIVRKSAPFYTQWWFLIIVALIGIVLILLVITTLCYMGQRRNKGKDLKRSTTNTTMMSVTPEPEDGGFPSLELQRSRRSLNRNGRVQNNIYARSPPRPSPASVTYSEDLPPVAGASGGGAVGGAAAIKPPMSDDGSSVLSEKPSNLGDSSDEVSSDESDDSSNESIAKVPVPASPPPPAFSSNFSKSHSHHHNNSSSGAGASSSSNNNSRPGNSSWRFQSPNNAYTYTDSEAESSHYAFSLNNGNLVVNNVAGARTPLSGFSSFV
ncbi:protein sidekick-2 isoform X2 [Aplysia californica]|uniref:Protein sidekick-2 isoform X2 n=1 Tax=Aplysia californica TaxID=6500 RepID=A0ABM1VPA7_APLCA|nr:protein sidekick-2 isoform X2 [Aplysia californica]